MDSATFEEAGYFDIYPSSDSHGYNGAWSNYPYFASGSIIVSGIEQGLFVVSFNNPMPPSPTPPSPTPPSPTPPSPTPPTPPTSCSGEEDTFEFTMLTDDYGEDITWVLSKKNNKGKFRKYLEGGSDEEYGDNTLYNEEYCIPRDECYRYIIKDSYGDGLCCGYGEGYYEISLNDSVLRSSTFKDKRRQKTTF